MQRTVTTVAPEAERQAIVVQVSSGAVTLRVFGDIDADSWPCLERALLACVDVEPECILLDLAAVPFVSASSCRHLDGALLAMRASGCRVVVEPARSLRRVAELTASVAVLGAVAAPMST